MQNIVEKEFKIKNLENSLKPWTLIIILDIFGKPFRIFFFSRCLEKKRTDINSEKNKSF